MLADLARRTLLLFGLLIFLIPLLSLASSGGAPSIALVAVLALMTAARPSSGLVGLALVLPLAFALTDGAGSSLSAQQVAEAFVIAFIAGALARSILDGRFFIDSRLARPALALGVIVAVWGLCAVFEQSADARVAIGALWRSARSYFVNRVSADTLQPTLHWLEFAALAPLVELTVRRRPAWRDLTVFVWLGASAAAAGSTVVRPFHDDVSAAGSLFAMLAVTAVVLSVTSRHRLAAAIASLPLIAGLSGTQSRAAIGAAIVVLGVLATRALFQNRRRVPAVVVLAVVAGSVIALWLAPARVGVGAAVHSRVELSKIALKITSQAPVFGVGLGRFAWASRDYVEPGLVVSSPRAALGENADNNFLQILAELGYVGLAAFVWLIWGAMRPMDVDRPVRAIRTALVAGLSAFCLSALFGQPLLIYPIGAATFVTLGLAAGMLPAREESSGSGLLRWAEWSLVALVLVSLPWRISAALSPGTLEVVGAGPLQPELEGVRYRVAEPQSRWRVRAHTRTVVALMRWDPAGATDCGVRIAVRNRPDDEVSLRPDIWIPVRFSIPPGGRPSEPPEVGFNVTSPRCRLFVGTVTAMR